MMKSLVRTRRDRRSSYCSTPVREECSFTVDPVTIHGNASLCFDEDGSHFQGAVDVGEDAHYSIHATRSVRCRKRQRTRSDGNLLGYPGAISAASDSQCECPGIADEGPIIQETYDLRIVDCDIGTEYSIKGVHLLRSPNHLKLSCQSIEFTSTETFRGQRADMMSQNILGHVMGGHQATVYVGSIVIDLPSKELRPWVL